MFAPVLHPGLEEGKGSPSLTPTEDGEVLPDSPGVLLCIRGSVQGICVVQE